MEANNSFNYGSHASHAYLPTLNLDNYDQVIRKYSPIRAPGEKNIMQAQTVQQMEKIYQNIKKDLTNLKP
jgi:hypothetical protein